MPEAIKNVNDLMFKFTKTWRWRFFGARMIIFIDKYMFGRWMWFSIMYDCKSNIRLPLIFRYDSNPQAAVRAIVLDSIKVAAEHGVRDPLAIVTDLECQYAFKISEAFRSRWMCNFSHIDKHDKQYPFQMYHKINLVNAAEFAQQVHIYANTPAIKDGMEDSRCYEFVLSAYNTLKIVKAYVAAGKELNMYVFAQGRQENIKAVFARITKLKPNTKFSVQQINKLLLKETFIDVLIQHKYLTRAPVPAPAPALQNLPELQPQNNN